jgi:hypothetical protein
MAKKTQGTLAKARSKFMRAMRDFEEVVAGVMSPSSEPKPKKTKKTKARKRTARKPGTKK